MARTAKQRSARKPKPAAKKPAAKKPAAKKAAGKKAGGKKPAKQATANKAAANKPAGKKPVARKRATQVTQPLKKPAPAAPPAVTATQPPPGRRRATRSTAIWQPTGRSWGADSHFARARDLELRGDLEGARDAYRLAIQDEDGGTGCELLLLDVLDRLRDVEGVFELVGHLEARGIGSVVISTTRSRALTRSNNWPEAIPAAEAAIAIDPSYTKAWLALAEAHRAGDDRASAAEAMAEVTRLVPAWSWGWFDLGSDLAALGRYDEAVTATEKVVELAPDLGEGWFNLACYRARAGHERGALDALEAAVRAAPKTAVMARTDEDLATVRAHPRFLALCGSA